LARSLDFDGSNFQNTVFQHSPETNFGETYRARLLLAPRADRSAGLGNEFDLVGRHFMEHLHMPVGHLLVARSVGNNYFYRTVIFDDVRLSGVLTPTTAAQKQHRLIRISIAIEPTSYSLRTPFVG
jgi:hypothetical protein